MRKVVVNSTPLIILGNVGELAVLKSLYGEIIIPQAVFDEVTKKNDAAKNLLEKNSDWIKIFAVKDKSDRKIYQAKLHDGEVEVMMLAKEISADLLIIDDNAAKKTAKFLGFQVTGTLGVLLRAKSEKIIPEVKPILEKMQAKNFYVSEEIRDWVLKVADEKNEIESHQSEWQ